jgi:serine/threonine-protein kinase
VLPKFKDMFLDEARIAVRLQHPNVVQVTDFGVEDGQPYLTMEYVAGETLASVLVSCRNEGRRLPIPLAARIVACACEGLHHAHELRDAAGKPLGVVHRDVSPQNVLISYDGIVKVADFGIAKAVDRTTQTRTGSIKGKVAYMSPEQALAQPVDRRCDVFSLGILLFEATLGRRLFRAESEFLTLQRVISATVPPPSSIDPQYPRALERIVLKALSARPEQRQETARALQLEIEQFLLSSRTIVGTAEISELMNRLFADRKQSRAEILAKVRSSPSLDLRPLQVDGGSTSLSFSGTLPLATDRSRARWPWLAGAAVGILGVGLIGGWLLATSGGARTDARQDGTVAAVSAPSGPDAAPDGSPGSGPFTKAPAPAEAGTDADAAPRVPPASVATDASADAEAAPPDADLQQDERGGSGQPPFKRGPAAPAELGRLNIIAVPWCDVYLGSRRLGRTPLANYPLPPGRYTLAFRPRGELPAVRRSVQVRPGATIPVSVDLSR